MVSGNGVGGAGWMGGGAEFRVFLYKKCFFYYSSKILYVKIKTFAWKKSFLCAWKFTANTWKLKKKSTWKTQTVREISEKSIREKRLPYVKKLKKSPKKRFTHTFYFHVGKKTLLAIVARYFRFDLVIWDLSIFGPVACHLRFNLAVPAQTANHYCLNKRIFVTEALIFTWFYEFWTSSLSVSLRPYDFSASSSSSFLFRSFDFCARSLLFSLIPWHFCASSLSFSFSPN